MFVDLLFAAILHCVYKVMNILQTSQNFARVVVVTKQGAIKVDARKEVYQIGYVQVNIIISFEQVLGTLAKVGVPVEHVNGLVCQIVECLIDAYLNHVFVHVLLKFKLALNVLTVRHADEKDDAEVAHFLQNSQTPGFANELTLLKVDNV